MRLCLPARMGGGGKTGTDALARASGQSPPHGGVCSGLGTRGQSPLAFPSLRHLRRQALPRAASAAHRNGALARRDADGRCVGKPSARQGCCIADAAPLTQSSARPALARQEERRERLRVSTKMPRPQERRMRGTERVLKHSRSSYPAPDRHPDGPGLQARSAQRTERVARRAAQSGTRESTLPVVPRHAIECENINRTYACQKGLIPTMCHKLSQR
jgi:hypothetical protein